MHRPLASRGLLCLVVILSAANSLHAWPSDDIAAPGAEPINARQPGGATGGGPRHRPRPPRRYHTAEQRAATLQDAERHAANQRHRRALAEGALRRPFKVYFDYQLQAGTTAAEQDYITNKLMPSVGAVLRQFLQVKEPLVGNLRLQPYCTSTRTSSLFGGSSCVQYDYSCGFGGAVTVPPAHLGPFGDNSGGPGVDADLIIYVTSSPSSTCGETLASSSQCFQDLRTNRPTAGNIDLCVFGAAQFELDLETVVHEVMHVLGFSSDFFVQQPGYIFESFVDDAGAALAATEITAQFFERGTTVTKIVLPRVVTAARTQFGCDTLNGGELEDDGGDGTAVTHWEQRIYEGELMDGTGGTDTFAGRHLITRMTLSLLEDTGWYAVNYDVAVVNPWGAGGGCDFATESCDTIFAGSDALAQSFFCDPNLPLNRTCTHDLTAIGTCASDPTWDGCRVIRPFSNSGSCLDVSQGGEAGSRCIIAEGDNGPQAVCAPMSCQGGALKVGVGSGLDCSGGAGTKQEAQLTGGGSSSLGAGVITLTCPSNTLTCGTAQPTGGWLTCPNDCSAQGRCTNGRCGCFLGYVGEDCSQAICLSDAECSAGQTCYSTGLCQPGVEVPVQYPITQGGLATGRSPQSASSAHTLQLMMVLAAQASLVAALW